MLTTTNCFRPGAFRVLGERDNHYTTETSSMHVTTVDLINSICYRQMIAPGLVAKYFPPGLEHIC